MQKCVTVIKQIYIPDTVTELEGEIFDRGVDKRTI